MLEGEAGADGVDADGVADANGVDADGVAGANGVAGPGAVTGRDDEDGRRWRRSVPWSGAVGAGDTSARGRRGDSVQRRYTEGAA